MIYHPNNDMSWHHHGMSRQVTWAYTVCPNKKETWIFSMIS